ILTDEDGVETLLYINQAERCIGEFELIEGPVVAVEESVTVTAEEMVQGDGLNELVSPALNGQPWKTANGGVHTVAVYFDEFVGRFELRGTLDEIDAPYATNWFTIPLTDNGYVEYLESFSGIVYFNFQENPNFV